jgi:lipoate synthase
MDARPEILNHNVETVPRLFKTVQPQDNYAWAKVVNGFANFHFTPSCPYNHKTAGALVTAPQWRF